MICISSQAQVAGAFQGTSEGSQVPATSTLFRGKTFGTHYQAAFSGVSQAPLVVYSTTQAAIPYNKAELEKT
jgi:hypothetical protein